MAERRAGTPAPLAGTLKLAPVSGQAEGIEIKPRRAFVKVEFRVPAGMVDEAAGILAARGALGCAARWPHRARQSSVAPVTLQAFFNRLTAAQVKAHHAALDSAGMLDPSGPAPIAQALIDPGWAVMWKKRFKPLAIGKTLAIVPPWNPNPPRGRIPVIIDPGLGFGTGHHPTTRCALIALETECARRHFETALDVGTGSGVLALAMARLGVKRIVALDNDPQALDNARHDAQLNGCAGAIRFSARAAPHAAPHLCADHREHPFFRSDRDGARVDASASAGGPSDLIWNPGPRSRRRDASLSARDAPDVVAHRARLDHVNSGLQATSMSSTPPSFRISSAAIRG